MTSAGFKRPGVACAGCGEAFSLSPLAIEGFVSIDRLPDPFHATCPLCRRESTYPKSAIGILAAVGPQ
jgi:hypothetical protein